MDLFRPSLRQTISSTSDQYRRQLSEQEAELERTRESVELAKAQASQYQWQSLSQREELSRATEALGIAMREKTRYRRQSDELIAELQRTRQFLDDATNDGYRFRRQIFVEGLLGAVTRCVTMPGVDEPVPIENCLQDGLQLRTQAFSSRLPRTTLQPADQARLKTLLANLGRDLDTRRKNMRMQLDALEAAFLANPSRHNESEQERYARDRRAVRERFLRTAPIEVDRSLRAFAESGGALVLP